MMIKKNRLITTIIGLLLLSSNSLASTTAAKSNANKTNISSSGTNDELQKIESDFKSYAAGISAELREEITKYRIEVAKINGQKRKLYKEISQKAQDYLAKERDYKKRILSLNKNSAKNQEDTSSVEKKSDKKDLPK
ncbi:MAG: hypothetical protein DMENIID0002_00910 [Rickettsia endosymbiont of Sergentomyia squamirostris]|uniref:Uncharacterized protein n=1 Tax=Candidatus Tisiphia endosymbiont of Sergentomyia squamirostris TaxID=3113639 RepID=A0AAT9G6P9_9RICK